MKECPWVEHLTNLPKWGVGALLSVLDLTMKERPYHVYHNSMPSKQIIWQTIHTTEPPKSSPDGTQHAEWHHVTVSMVWLTVHTALAMSVYTKMPCSNLLKCYTKFLTSVMHSTWGCYSETPQEARSRVGAHLSKLYSQKWALFQQTTISVTSMCMHSLCISTALYYACMSTPVTSLLSHTCT